MRFTHCRPHMARRNYRPGRILCRGQIPLCGPCSGEADASEIVANIRPLSDMRQPTHCLGVGVYARTPQCSPKSHATTKDDLRGIPTVSMEVPLRPNAGPLASPTMACARVDLPPHGRPLFSVACSFMQMAAVAMAQNRSTTTHCSTGAQPQGSHTNSHTQRERT